MVADKGSDDQESDNLSGQSEVPSLVHGRVDESSFDSYQRSLQYAGQDSSHDVGLYHVVLTERL